MHVGLDEVIIHDLQIRKFTAQFTAEVVDVKDMAEAVLTETQIRDALVSPHVIPAEEALGGAFRNSLNGFDGFHGAYQGRLPIQ